MLKFLKILILLLTQRLYNDVEGEGDGAADAGEGQSTAALLESIGLDSKQYNVDNMTKSEGDRVVSDVGIDTALDKAKASAKESDTTAYKINNESVSRADIEKQMSDELGTDFSKLTPEKAETVIKKYVQLQNVEEGTKKVNEGSKKNADERKRVAKLEADFEKYKENVQKEFDDEKNSIAQEKAALKKKIQQFRDDEDNEYDETKKFELIADRRDLERQLTKVEQNEKTLPEKQKEIEKEIRQKGSQVQEQKKDEKVVSLVYKLSSLPEFTTEKNVIDILIQARNGHLKDDDPEFVKALTIRDIVRDYKDTYGLESAVDITKFYNSAKRKYFPNAAQSEVKDTKATIKDFKETKSESKFEQQKKDYAPTPKSNLSPISTGKAVPTYQEMLADVGQ